MPRFASFDQRGYRTLRTAEGYGLWAETYEGTIKPDMDVRLLERLASVDWTAVARAADLGCGTGRTGAWLADRGAKEIHGVDVTPEMLQRAQARGAYARLELADVCATPFMSGHYDLVISSLVDEHLPDLRPLYVEAARIASDEGVCVLVGYHPFFIMKAGMPTHFNAPGGEPVAIETHVHLMSDHVRAAHAAGWQLSEMHEQVIDDGWIEIKASWAQYRDCPISFVMVWRREAGRGRRDA
jgi:SAM-dependent methyltransferase